jgi:hypothetical protein
MWVLCGEILFSDRTPSKQSLRCGWRVMHRTSSGFCWWGRHCRRRKAGRGISIKKIFTMTIIAFLTAANSWAVVVTGSGPTKEDAISNGLREAVEMYAGALVYGVTDVMNYQARKDQIVATSLGYVKSYRIIKTSMMDDLLLITLDVALSEDKIQGVIRDNVKLITWEDVLKDYDNVVQRQEQMKKLAEMAKILAGRPVHEKYGVIYEGYEIIRIGVTEVDVVLNVRITVNPYYSRAYNHILKNLSEGASSAGTLTVGGNYRIESGKLVNSRYYISKGDNVPIFDDLHARVHVNGVPVDQCREYRDNLMVAFSPAEFVKGFVMIFPKAFMREMKDEESKIDDKWNNAAIKKSRIIPPEGLPLRIKYRISDSKDIKTLWNLKLSMAGCGKDKPTSD